MTEVTPRFKTGTKPKRRRPNEKHWRDAVHARSGGRCASCGYRGRHVSAHHLVFKSHCEKQYVLDVRNGVTLCNAFAKACHEAVHGGTLKVDPRWLRRDQIECLAEQGLTWDEHGEPVGTLARYFGKRH